MPVGLFSVDGESASTSASPESDAKFSEDAGSSLESSVVPPDELLAELDAVPDAYELPPPPLADDDAELDEELDAVFSFVVALCIVNVIRLLV